MKEWRPYVFIGSSSEGQSVAEAIQTNLDSICECHIWSQGIFGLTTGTLESLVNALDRFDFAVLVLTPDDLNVSRGQEQQSPRDNVLFELGLFMGALGKERTFIVVDGSAKLKLPSDLAGVTLATFQPPDAGTMEAALGKACSKIKREINLVVRKSNTTKTYTYEKFKEIEKRAKEEVWIVSIPFLVEVDSFYDVVAFNLSRGIRYRYFVDKHYNYASDLEFLIEKLSRDLGTKLNIRTLISVEKLPFATLPCTFVFLDPKTVDVRGFALIENELLGFSSWVQISASQVARFVSTMRVTSIQKLTAKKLR